MKEKLSSKFIFYPLLVLLIGYTLVRSAKHVMLWHEKGIDVYNDPGWQNSQTIQMLKTNGLAGQIFSNDAHAIYHFTGLNAYQIPKKIYSHDELFRKIEEAESPSVVWFFDPGRYHLYDLEEIKKNFGLRKITSFNDGVIYELQR